MRVVVRQRYDCRIAGFGFRNDLNERKGIDWKIKHFMIRKFQIFL